jgi:hypothetical protein
MEEDTRKALNDLARHRMIHRVLADIRIDMEVCEIEGWDKLEYLRTLQKEIGGLGSAYIITKQDTDRRA